MTLGDSRVPLGMQLLAHKKGRLALSGSGIAVAVVIMFVELGFFHGVVESQAKVARLFNGDLVALHKNRTHLNKWNGFGRIRLAQLSAFDELREVIPIYKGTMGLRNPDNELLKRIVAYAFPPHAAPFRISRMDELGPRLSTRNTVLFDRASRKIFGRFQRGRSVELDGMHYRVAGLVTLGPNLVNDGTVLMSEGSWLKRHPTDTPVMAVLRVRDGLDVGDALRRIAARLPDDLQIMTPQALYQREVDYTVHVAPIGTIFGVGLVAGIIIGILVCHQVLFNEIADHLAQYATLKAMGFSERTLNGIVTEEALTLSLAGFAIGASLAYPIYWYVESETALVMALEPSSLALVFALTLAICVTAGLLAARRVARLDPAELF